jgi:hypothetical protein
VSDRRKNKPKARRSARDKPSKRDRFARTFRKHYDRAVAEKIWCINHMRELISSGQCAPTVDVKPFCGEHWRRMWKEWYAVARLCRRQAKVESSTGHPVVAEILRAVADKLTRPGSPVKAVTDAGELLAWLPSPAISVRDAQAEALEEVTRFPVLDGRAKADVIEQIRTRPGRPRVSRGVAVQALELHRAGRSWSQIERELLPNRQNVKNPGEDIRRQVQHLNVVLRRHGISLT